MIFSALKECNEPIAIRVTTATEKTLNAEMSRGYRVLHYSGHGTRDSLSFEDDTGCLKNCTVERLKEALGAHDRTRHGQTSSVMVRDCFNQSGPMTLRNLKRHSFPVVFVIWCYVCVLPSQ